MRQEAAQDPGEGVLDPRQPMDRPDDRGARDRQEGPVAQDPCERIPSAPSAALAAVPLADAGIKYAADVSRSIVAQVSDAIRQPMLSSEVRTVRTTRRGTQERVTRASLPAWVAIGGLLVAAWWMAPQRPGDGGTGFSWNPLTGILGGLLPH